MKIGIADSQAMVRFSLRIFLEQQQGWMVGGEAADFHELFDLLRNALMDLLLVDLDLPDMPADDLTKRPGVSSGRSGWDLSVG